MLRKLSVQLNETTTTTARRKGTAQVRAVDGRGGIVVVLGQGGYVTNMMLVLLVAIQLMGNNQTEINVIPFLWLKWVAVLVQDSDGFCSSAPVYVTGST